MTPRHSHLSPLFRRGVALASLLMAAGAPSASRAQDAPAATARAPVTGPKSPVPFSLYISSESGDIVSRIRVDSTGWRVVRTIPVGLLPTEIAGPHNVAVSPDGRSWYVSISHGKPWGSVWRFDAESDTLIGRATVGLFPTTIGLSPDGKWAYVPDSDFHGDRGGRNTVSVIFTPTMRTVQKVPTCDMPHGSRWNHAGSRVYIACMMSDELLTMDPGAMSITQRVALGSGTTMSMTEHQRMEAKQDSLLARGDTAAARAAAQSHTMPMNAGHDMSVMTATKPAAKKAGAASSTMAGQDPDCLTTYVSVSPDDRVIYLVCNHSNEVQERDANTLALLRRTPTGIGAYNVEPSPNGALIVVTNKKQQSISILDAKTFHEIARVPTTKKIPHGIAFSPDSRYAFVTQESVGSDPGAVDVIDLVSLTRIATMEIPRQPTGIAMRRDDR